MCAPDDRVLAGSRYRPRNFYLRTTSGLWLVSIDYSHRPQYIVVPTQPDCLVEDPAFSRKKPVGKQILLD
jgi:hypothetical protein